MSRHHAPICESSGKVRFREPKDIKRALRRADQDRSRARLNDVACNRREIESYSCSDCNGWHLTSQQTRPVRLTPVARPLMRTPGPAAGAMRRMASATGFTIAAA
ncbi:MAG TPA: hypothetical protein VFF32_03100 [Dermatophilaceae bacterium]|nr:hypothetical protein [Dermatophilaceae bacterium]